MKARQLRRARNALTGQRVAAVKAANAEDELRYAEVDDYDEMDDGYCCTRCGGEGYDQVDDPFWDECDEYGYGPCTACSGTGERRHQTVF